MQIRKYASEGTRYHAFNNAHKITEVSIIIISDGGASCLNFNDLGCLKITFRFHFPY